MKGGTLQINWHDTKPVLTRFRYRFRTRFIFPSFLRPSSHRRRRFRHQGYGDIHAVNLREMIFVMVYVSFDMVLGAYLVGNMTALIVKGSKTERYRDRMSDLLRYMDRNRLGRDIRNQIQGHMRLQYDSSYTDSVVIQNLPSSVRAKISETLYKPYIEQVSLFRGCSLEFINHIVARVHEEFFLPGEVILEQGVVVDQLYW